MAIRSFMPFAYVVSLQGKNVLSGHSNQCLIEGMDELKDVRNLMKDKYNLEFTEFCTSFIGTGYQEFGNISDDRDITLVVERVEILNVKQS